MLQTPGSTPPQRAGHTNVFYIGDRVRRPGQLNGKSANLNHVVLNKIYPGAQRPEDIPFKDILMVVDCDHMCKPNLFNKMAPPLRDSRVGVVLVPQWFHNLLRPVRRASLCCDLAAMLVPQ